DPPTTAAETYVTSQDTPLTIAAPGVLANDIDIDGDALSVALVSGPSDGTLVLNADGSLTYTPADGFNGPDSFTYRVTDAIVTSPPITATVRVGHSYAVMAPMVRGKPSAPDLVASLALTPDTNSFAAGQQVLATVTITNTGTGATESGFWVDLYVHPSRMPATNLRWDRICGIDPCRGIAWYVSRSLAPGQSITLHSLRGSYVEEATVWDGRLPAGTRSLYVYVDSWNPSVDTGAIRELDEANNLFGRTNMTVAGVAVAPKQGAVELPARPLAPQQ
ncbi:MAG: hypothetical protein RLZZ387_585, partial [Chloroflexota bacterium]